MPHPLHAVRGATVGRVCVEKSLEHNGVLLWWQVDVSAQRVMVDWRVRGFLQVEDHSIVFGEFVHGAGDRRDQLL